MNGPTRTVEIVINFAAVTPPVASCNWMVGSVGWGSRPIFAANSVESVDEAGARIEDHRGRHLAIQGHIDLEDSSFPSHLDGLAEHGFLPVDELFDTLVESAGGPELQRATSISIEGVQGGLDRVVLGQLGVSATGRVDKLAEVEDRLDVLRALLRHLVVDVLLDTRVARPDFEQAELIVDFVESRHELVVQNDVLSIDGLELPAEENPFLQECRVPFSSARSTACSNSCCCLRAKLNCLKMRWASLSLSWISDSAART